MCLACEEMDLYFAYLAHQDADKRASGEDARAVESIAPTADASGTTMPAQAAFNCDAPAKR